MEKTIFSPTYRAFLRELKQARRRSGLTQTELAAKLGETQSFVSKCERGERRLDVIELRYFVQAMGISFVDFVTRLDEALSRKRGSGA